MNPSSGVDARGPCGRTNSGYCCRLQGYGFNGKNQGAGERKHQRSLQAGCAGSHRFYGGTLVGPAATAHVRIWAGLLRPLVRAAAECSSPFTMACRDKAFSQPADACGMRRQTTTSLHHTTTTHCLRWLLYLRATTSEHILRFSREPVARLCSV